jgi:DNA-directed RNA polymerase I, II, and III subunit RPABC2
MDDFNNIDVDGCLSDNDESDSDSNSENSDIIVNNKKPSQKNYPSIVLDEEEDDFPDNEIDEENDIDFEDESIQDGGGKDDEYDESDDDEKINNINLEDTNNIKKNIVSQTIDSEDDENEENSENYLQKFDRDINNNYITDYHPECMIHNYDEITILTKIVRDNNNIIIDDLHKTIPFLTKYEKARILGQRAKQINYGAKPFIKVPENVIDGYVIAELELHQKRIPFIIRRPIANGGSEYWNLRDLEIINF